MATDNKEWIIIENKKREQVWFGIKGGLIVGEKELSAYDALEGLCMAD